MVGQTLAKYRIVDKLGEGGMGVVWKALDTQLEREVAIKVLPEHLAADPERLARFEREAKLLASLNHRNIATLYGLEQAEGVRFIVMELAEGEDLAKRLERGPLPVHEALDVAHQLAERFVDHLVVGRQARKRTIQLRHVTASTPSAGRLSLDSTGMTKKPPVGLGI